ncbi:MAG: hypothetical protein NTY35_05050 [Planctomycetota bacterium]|nr:hypothetical protein [Planctomycetota bacterium]
MAEPGSFFRVQPRVESDSVSPARSAAEYAGLVHRPSPHVKKIAAAFRRHALGHAAASWDGDSRGADRHHRRLIEALLALRDHGIEGQSALLRLLEDEEGAVRGWAAAHSLELDETRSTRILEEVANDPRLVGIEASAVLEEWRAGRPEGP